MVWVAGDGIREPFRGDDRADDPTWLYRYYSDSLEPLYVGITSQIYDRNKAHSQAWWHQEAAIMFVECFPCRHVAASAELYAISAEQPRANIIRKGDMGVSQLGAVWFFNLNGGKLNGFGRCYVDPHTFDLAEVLPPRGFSPAAVGDPKLIEPYKRPKKYSKHVLPWTDDDL